MALGPVGSSPVLPEPFKSLFPFLRNQERWSSNLTKNDFIPEEMDKVVEIIRNWSEERARSIFERGQECESAHFNLKIDSNLRPEVKKRAEAHMKDVSKKIANLRVDAFCRGSTIKDLDNVRCDFKPMELKSEDLINPPSVSVINDHRAYEKRQKICMNALNLRSKLYNRELTKEVETLFTKVDNMTSHVCQLRWYYAISKTLNKSISDLTNEDLKPYVKDLEKVIEEDKQQKEEAANKAFNEWFLTENEESKNTKKNQKRNEKQNLPKKNQKQETNKNINKTSSSSEKKVVLSKLHKKVIALNDPHFKPKFSLHEHVLRWKTNDFEVIKNLEDFDSQKKCRIKRYENKSLSELKNAKNDHNLCGIERFLSDPELYDQYTVPYQYTANSGQIQNGRCLLCTKDDGKKQVSGFIFLGIGEGNVIYHGMFDQLSEKVMVPDQVFKVFEDLDSTEKKESEEKWNLTNSCVFSLGDNDVIKMEIDKKAEARVIFSIYPLTISSN